MAISASKTPISETQLLSRLIEDVGGNDCGDMQTDALEAFALTTYMRTYCEGNLVERSCLDYDNTPPTSEATACDNSTALGSVQKYNISSFTYTPVSQAGFNNEMKAALTNSGPVVLHWQFVESTYDYMWGSGFDAALREN